MSKLLELEFAEQSIKAAFKPLQCVTENYDYHHKVRFRVFSADDDPLLSVDDLLASRVCEIDGLSHIVAEARANLESRGYRLEPWGPPKAAER
jgi:hypothetical protein